MNKQLISLDEKKRREHLLQVKYQTIILDHLAKSKLNDEEYKALTDQLEANKKLFEDIDLFVDFTTWN
ncbi:MAG: hypothetical protein CML74_04455 [Rhodobiaceae bacterium]|nr:hypothetical protein [Rhodobiaceae bacterium]|tara:strand:+ start:335 stop:538 length:204 start_codon:yes stop_codon:yes gene_type:complete